MPARSATAPRSAARSRPSTRRRGRLVVLGQTVRVLDTTRHRRPPRRRLRRHRRRRGARGARHARRRDRRVHRDAARADRRRRRLQNPGHRVQPRQRRPDLHHRLGADLVRRRRAGAGQPGQRRAGPGSRLQTVQVAGAWVATRIDGVGAAPRRRRRGGAGRHDHRLHLEDLVQRQRHSGRRHATPCSATARPAWRSASRSR